MDATESAAFTRLVIYTSDSVRSGRKPLHWALVELLHAVGIAGATALHGFEGYGTSRRIHTAKIELLSLDLPVVIMAIDRAERIEAILPQVAALVQQHGLITLEQADLPIRPRTL